LTIFFWNQKYILKFEKKDFEQTFKISQLDILEEEIEGLSQNKEFLKKIKARFQSMQEDIEGILEN